MSTNTPFDIARYDQHGPAFDKFLPFIQPVGEAILARLPDLRAGATVLDLACGTGEPGLSLARSRPGTRLLGVDAADGMLAIARRKAVDEHLRDVRFEAMPLEALALEDRSVDAAISRFGFLLFGDPTRSASELARVLKPEAVFSVAVWEETAANTLLSATIDALATRLKPEQLPRFDHFELLAATGRREEYLREAGFRRIESEPFRWDYAFPDFESIWQLISGPGLFADLFAKLDEAELDAVRRRLTASVASFRSADGAYSLPHTCRVFWGSR